MLSLREIYKNFIIGDIKNTEEEPDVDAWEAFLRSLKKPSDVVDEAYNKYLCRRQYYSGFKSFLMNAASVLVLAAHCRSFLGKKEALTAAPGEGKLVVETRKDPAVADVMPPELPAGYNETEMISFVPAKAGQLSAEAKELFDRAVRRYPMRPYFHLWLLQELSKHCAYIRKYDPDSLAVYVNERNVASPVITELYERTGRKFISFMHGEYLLQMIQAYMRFSEFYIWDENYVEMFRDDLRCGIEKYIVTKPLKLTKKWHLEDIEPEVYCTYYFSGESTTSVRKLAEIFKEMESKGHRCLVRPHPRYSHLELLEETFPKHMIEEPREVTMEESLGRTTYAAGLHTTVLAEAQIEGRTAVIDDLSDPPQFVNLEKRKFVVLKRPHKLLSEIL